MDIINMEIIGTRGKKGVITLKFMILMKSIFNRESSFVNNKEIQRVNP